MWRLEADETALAETIYTLTDAMERTGVRRTDLADQLGVSRAYVTQALSGKYNLTIRTVAKLADALGYRVRITLEPQ